jgi:hypothetical protein
LKTQLYGLEQQFLENLKTQKTNFEVDQEKQLAENENLKKEIADLRMNHAQETLQRDELNNNISSKLQV